LLYTFGTALPQDKKVVLNGSFWNQMPDAEKFGYVIGYIDAYQKEIPGCHQCLCPFAQI